MLIGDLEVGELSRKLTGDGVRIAIGPFVISIRSTNGDIAPTLSRCYSNYSLSSGESFTDARVSVEAPSSNFWRNDRDGVIRLNDGNTYSEFPRGSELPYIEWGINLCIATRAHHFLMLHAGVLEKNGMALLLPGLPGSGKSTLSAYLMHHGWRLLSDEFAMVTGPDLQIHPFPRLIPLKNESIDVIRRAIPDAQIGPQFEGTPKGTVAHVSPKRTDIARMFETAVPKLIIFPKFEEGAETRLEEDTKPRSFVELTKHAFNYILRGKTAFEMTTRLVDDAECFRLVYSELEEAAVEINRKLEMCVAKDY